MHTMSRGLIFFAHGSRDPAWATTLQALAGEIGAIAPTVPVRCAYLELLQPDLSTVIDELASQVHQLDICPIFWAGNGHVQRDLPRLLSQAQQRHPQLGLQLRPVLSELPGLLPWLARTLAAGVGHPPPGTAGSLS